MNHLFWISGPIERCFIDKQKTPAADAALLRRLRKHELAGYSHTLRAFVGQGLALDASRCADEIICCIVLKPVLTSRCKGSVGAPNWLNFRAVIFLTIVSNGFLSRFFCAITVSAKPQ